MAGLLGRSREGAWIEICGRSVKQLDEEVAPARERGLKCSYVTYNFTVYCSRSREGAWIEILYRYADVFPSKSRSREGAWIEIPLLEMVHKTGNVAPARERGLKF